MYVTDVLNMVILLLYLLLSKNHKKIIKSTIMQHLSIKYQDTLYLLESCQHSLVIFATVYMTLTLFQRPNYRQFNETNPYPCLPWGTCPSPLCSPASGRGYSCAISLPPCILPDRGLPCCSCTPMAAGNSCHSGHTPLSHIPYFPSPFQHTLSPYHHGSRSLFLCC